MQTKRDMESTQGLVVGPVALTPASGQGRRGAPIDIPNEIMNKSIRGIDAAVNTYNPTIYDGDDVEDDEDNYEEEDDDLVYQDEDCSDDDDDEVRESTTSNGPRLIIDGGVSVEDKISKGLDLGFILNQPAQTNSREGLIADIKSKIDKTPYTAQSEQYSKAIAEKILDQKVFSPQAEEAITKLRQLIGV